MVETYFGDWLKLDVFAIGWEQSVFPTTLFLALLFSKGSSDVDREWKLFVFHM